MSKIKGIEKRRFFSFFIYHLIAIWILSGCAAKSSMDKGVSALQNPSAVERADIESDTEIQYLSASIGEDDTAIAGAAEKYTESEPHMLLKPGKSDEKQIVGIDFTMLENGKSKLIVTTNKEVVYNLDRVNTNTLALNIDDSVIIPDLLTRDVDTTEYPSAVNSVKPVFDKEAKRVSIGISLREMVPFHIKQADNRITMEFAQTRVKGKETQIVPLDLDGAEVRSLAASKIPAKNANTSVPVKNKKYTGKPMDLEFFDEDVTNIFRLMNEMSDENIIWDPELKGTTVSMILDKVPWDQALDLILLQKNLAKRYVGKNILSITTKQKMKEILDKKKRRQRK
jgi:type IV pilus assembly protein PilQ